MKQDPISRLVIVTGFLALSYLFDADVFRHIALGLGLVFLLSERLSNYVLWFWWKLAHVLGWINTRILLTIVFYTVLLPFALLSRLFSKDPLSIKWKPTNSSYLERNHLYLPGDLDNPW